MIEIEVGISIDCHSAITSQEQALIDMISDEMVKEIDDEIIRELNLCNYYMKTQQGLQSSRLITSLQKKSAPYKYSISSSD